MTRQPEIMEFFDSAHLSPKLSLISRQFEETAQFILDNMPDCDERAVALRKLLESKDAAVRAKTLQLRAEKK